jgi:chromosomal replication initiation ATPase DnaA
MDRAREKPRRNRRSFTSTTSSSRTAGRLLLTARTPPRALAHRAPRPEEPHSRRGHRALEPPDDALLSAVLVKLFADRQIAVAPALVAYLVPRIDRSFAAPTPSSTGSTAPRCRRPPRHPALAARLLDNATGGEA